MVLGGSQFVRNTDNFQLGPWLSILLGWRLDREFLPWEGRGGRGQASKAGNCTRIWMWRRAVHLRVRGNFGSSSWASSSVGAYPKSSCMPTPSDSLSIWPYPPSLLSPISAGRQSEGGSSGLSDLAGTGDSTSEGIAGAFGRGSSGGSCLSLHSGREIPRV